MDYGVKIYPRLVHALKSLGTSFKGPYPKTMRGFQSRCKSVGSITDMLSKVDPADLGGFRIEVSFCAPTLAAAKAQLEATPLLDPRFWLRPPE